MSLNPAEGIPISPFQSIALCFSGGGFRAAAYSLGVLSYLNKIKFTYLDNEASLLTHVNFIASTSGGTITNLVYSSYLSVDKVEETAFQHCFVKLYTELTGDKLLEEAIRLLSDHEIWDPSVTSKQRNVINAFSKVYDDRLLNGKTFNVFWEQSQDKDFAVCFNSTEFTRGISFRFQNESDKQIRELAGNRFIRFKAAKKAVLGRLKLADILAASSCFPSGFEPIIFPEDFAYTDKTGSKALSLEELKDSVFVEGYDDISATISNSIALMDGGVTDNQALYSIMYADKRRRKNHPFDLVMVNDVTSYYMEPYKVETDVKSDWGERNINDYLNKFSYGLKWYTRLRISVICVFLISVAGIFFLSRHGLSSLFYFLLGFSALGLIVLGCLQYVINKNPLVKTFLSKNIENKLNDWAKEKFKGKFSETVVRGLLSYLKEAKFSNLKQLVMSRVNSVITMSVEVNLKQVRRLIYTIFYENKIWDNRRASNFIYELSLKNSKSRTDRLIGKNKSLPTYYLTVEDKKILLDLKTKIPEIADEARAMGTTLWFGKMDEDKNMLDQIIQCGQFTACVNLLEYTLTLIRQAEAGVLNFDNAVMKNLNELKDKLISDWETLSSNALFHLT